MNNLIVISDTHCGDQLGLCPSGRFRLDDGGWYHPSRQQCSVWRYWLEFWNSWVPRACHQEPCAVVVNGDLIENRHHRATHPIQNLANQFRLAHIVFAPIVEQCRGRFYVVRGTAAHAGQSAENEETIARELGATPDEVGRYSRPDLRILLGGRARIHIKHHIETTRTSSYESTAILKALINAYVNSGTWGAKPYDAVVRSHRHTFMMVTRPSVKGYAFSFTTPGWQLPTPYVNEKGDGGYPQIGGSLLRVGDEDFYTRHYLRYIKPSAIVNI